MSVLTENRLEITSVAELLRTAEQRLGDAPNPVDTLSKTELREYVRELEVQRVECELRTAELERVRAVADDLATRNSQFRDAAPVCLLLMDRTGQISFATAAAATIFGVDGGDPIHRSLASFVVPEDRAAVVGFLNRACESGVKQTVRFRILAERKTVHVLAEGLIDPESVSPEREVCVVLVNNSEYAKAEQTLHEQETVYRSLIDNIDLGILLLDCDYLIVAANPAMCRISGLTAAELVGKKCCQAFFHQDRLCSYCPGARAIWTRQISQAEMPRVKKDGTPYRSMITAIPMMGPDENVVGLLEVVRDLTEQRRREDQLREFASVVAAKNQALQERAAALEAATHAKNDFMAGMSHDLRTPLNTIIGLSDGLLDRVNIHPLNEHQLGRIRRIKQNGQFLLTLLNGVLDLSKAEAGKTWINMTQWDVGVFVRDLATVAEGLLQGRPGVRFALDVEEGLSAVVSDRDKLRQIVIQLLSNAAKSTVQGTITLGVRRQGRTLLVRVDDTGGGVSQQRRHQVFERFFQVTGATVQPIDGSGFRSALCKAYAELLGGNIFAQSVGGQGCRFTVALPIVDDKDSEAVAKERGSAASPSENTVKVLCVEPNTADMLLLTDYLVDAGCQVVQIADGADVMPQAIRATPQAILLDLALPHADGCEVFNLLKSHPITRSIPVVVVTSLHDESRAAALGAADYLRKPIERLKLVESLQQVLAGASRRMGLAATEQKSDNVLAQGVHNERV